MNMDLPELLVVTIPDKNNFYSLYADGSFIRKKYIREAGHTLIFFDRDAIVFLYYTYPTHREVCVIRNTPSGSLLFPGLSKRVSLLCSVQASKVDKFRRAVAFLNANAGDAYSRNDGFYIRLGFILAQKGKINYPALCKLTGGTAGNTVNQL
jgi:hypothetical protein